MTRNYPDKARALPVRSTLEESQLPPYSDTSASDTFPARYSDIQSPNSAENTLGEPDAPIPLSRTETSNLGEVDEVDDRQISQSRHHFSSRRNWTICLVVFAILLGVWLIIPVVAAVSVSNERPVPPPSDQKPIAPLTEKPSSPSRETYISQTSTSLSGSYPLLDLLSIATTSGSINVGVTPQPADPAVPKPASLIIKSRSGSINANFPIYAGGGIPTRNYITQIETQSGSVSGSYFLGSRTTFGTRSGTLSLALLPIFPDRAESGNPKFEFKTETNSGTQNIEVQSPLVFAAAGGKSSSMMKNLISSHIGRSGTFNLHYPRDWEGEVEIRTGSGTINVGGEGLRVLEQRRGWLRAVKGDGQSQIKVEGGSGTVNFGVG
ncbi:MAG: hypothetical protein M1812_004490 [Candelaria pacifica]|nr:MAG: hypothetical protein M1812_004490 [Candelaria pacifica]